MDFQLGSNQPIYWHQLLWGNFQLNPHLGGGWKNQRKIRADPFHLIQKLIFIKENWEKKKRKVKELGFIRISSLQDRDDNGSAKPQSNCHRNKRSDEKKNLIIWILGPASSIRWVGHLFKPKVHNFFFIVK